MDKWKALRNSSSLKNFVSNKPQYYSDEFKKRRYEMQGCEDFQPCRKFIAEELAIHLIIDIITVKSAELRAKLGFNQVDWIISKQESIGLRIKKTFSSKEIIEDFSALNYLIDFYFPKYKLAVKIDELGHANRESVKKNKRQKELEEHLKCTFIGIKTDFSA